MPTCWCVSVFGESQHTGTGQTYDDVDVSRPVRVPVQHVQELARRAVIRHRIRSRPKAVQPVVAVLVSSKVPAEVELGLVGVLLLVQAVGGALPDVDLCAGDGLVGCGVADNSVHVDHLAVVGLLHDDVGVVGGGRGVVAEEGAEDGGLGHLVGGAGDGLVGDFVDETALV